VYPMKWVLALGLLAFASGQAHSAPAKSKASSSKTPTAKAAYKGRATHGTNLHKTRKHLLHIAPEPTFQLHPDPDRYQQIQQALADKGYFKGEVNGTWNDDSMDALRRFQADQKLPDDGKISAPTLIGLGLGPKRDGNSPTVPAAPPAPESTQ